MGLVTATGPFSIGEPATLRGGRNPQTSGKPGQITRVGSKHGIHNHNTSNEPGIH